MLKSITLRDFISHRDNTIRLGDGVTVFIGRNGSGKSSVIDAITYALYGEHTRSSNRNLVRYGASRASIVLEFSMSNREYRVEKRLNTNGNLESAILSELRDGSWKIVAAGERKQAGDTMSREIERIIGLDYEKMRVAAIIQQGEIDRIIEYRPKDFKELINSVIGIDRLDDAWSKMSDVVNGFRERLRRVYKYDDNNIGTLSDDLSRYEREVEKMRAMVSMMEEESRKVEARRSMLESEYMVMKLKRERFEVLKAQMNNLHNYIEERRRALERDVVDMKSTLRRAEEYIALVEREAGIRASLKDAEDRLSALNDEMGRLSQEYARLEATKQLLRAKSDTLGRAREQMEVVERLRHVHDELLTLRARLEEVSNSITSRNNEMGRLRGLMECASRLEFKDNVCPVCGSRVERINPLFDKGILERHMQEITEELSRLSKERLDVENRLKRMERLNEQLQRAEGFLSMHGITSMDDIDALAREVSKMMDDVGTIDSLKSRLDSLMAERDAMARRLEEYRRRLEEVSRARAFLDAKGITDRDALEGLRATIRGHEAVLARLRMLPEVRDVHEFALSVAASASSIQEYAIDEYSTSLVKGIVALADECRGFSHERYSMLESELRDVEREEKVMGEELSRLRGRLDELSREIERLRPILVVLEHARRYIGLLEGIRSRVFHRDGYVATSLRSWALQQISEKASEYAKVFSMDISRIELKEEGRMGKGVEEGERGRGEVHIQCYGRRGPVDVASMSGGEKVAVALALRFAIAYVMGGYRLDFVIMDEPTVHLDEERRASIVELVRRLAEGSTLRQIVMITHDSEIFEDADVDHLYRFEMTDNGSIVSEVKY
ncbi:MAG: SMC family ATPase [Candidatus Nitrosocaldus sp.]|nr:SMC family ATPase [Candidatus Nitrosocaldus sp.]MDW8275042.1 SMC family ATPase [Candidatus Nitrosocaldus sp.]